MDNVTYICRKGCIFLSLPEEVIKEALEEVEKYPDDYMVVVTIEECWDGSFYLYGVWGCPWEEYCQLNSAWKSWYAEKEIYVNMLKNELARRERIRQREKAGKPLIPEGEYCPECGALLYVHYVYEKDGHILAEVECPLSWYAESDEEHAIYTVLATPEIIEEWEILEREVAEEEGRI